MPASGANSCPAAATVPARAADGDRGSGAAMVTYDLTGTRKRTLVEEAAEQHATFSKSTLKYKKYDDGSDPASSVKVREQHARATRGAVGARGGGALVGLAGNGRNMAQARSLRRPPRHAPCRRRAPTPPADRRRRRARWCWS